MVRSSRLLTLAALAVFVLVSPARAEDMRLGRDVLPTFQTISLRLDAGTTSYTGTTGIDLQVKKQVDQFRFHAEGVTLDTLQFSGPQGPIELTHTTGEKGLVTATLKQPVPPGAYHLDIKFHDTFNTDAVGLYRMEKDGEAYAFSQFEADDAREAFPCWDEPSFKLPYQIILSVPEGQVAIANTLPEKETVEKGWKTTVFRTTKPLPSYLLNIATGHLETVDIPGLGVPGRVVTVKGQSGLAKAAAETTGPILKSLEKYFGSKYPYDKLDLIAVPEYWAGAMENPGAITYSDNILLLDPASVTVNQMRRLVRVSAHELAHMWFGDLVTMAWWDDLWLNESFADWMGDKITQDLHPEYEWGLSALQDSQRIMFSDAEPSTRAIRQPVESTDDLFANVGLAYDKGKAILFMFERWIGPETFRKGVLSYLQAHAWGTATADDLWKELDKASGKKVSEMMAGFIEQPGVPLVTLSAVADGKITLTQQRFHNAGVNMSDLSWKIPLGLRIERNGKVESKTVLLAAPSQTIDLGKGVAWVYPNTDAYGYYRWSAPPEMMKVLTSNTQKLTARERIGLISNSTALLLAGALSGDAYLHTLEVMGTDPEPLVLASLLDALEAVKTVIPSENSDIFAAYIRRTLGPALQWVGLEAQPGEDEALSIIRPRLIAWMGDEGRDAAVQSFAMTKAKAYLDNLASVDPALIATCLDLAAHQGDKDLFDAYRVHAEGAHTPAVRQQFLSALGAFREPALRTAALDYVLAGSLRPNELFTIPQSVGEDEAGRELSYHWMTEHYDAITGRLPKEFAGFMPMFASGCSEARLKDAKTFFSDPSRQAPGLERTISQLTDRVEDCVQLREREGQAMTTYLQETAQASTAHPATGSPR
jgi:aminopeptidase N